jgi:hypothetical protein
VGTNTERIMHMTKIMIDGDVVDVDDDVVTAILELSLDIAEDLDAADPEPDEQAKDSSDQYAIYRWGLADGRSLFVDSAHGGVVSAGVDGGSIADRLLDWDHDDVPETAEWMAAWGYSGLAYLEEAKEGYDAPCRVWCEPNYYPGTYGAPDPHFIRTYANRRDDDVQFVPYDEDIREFVTYAEAEAYVDEYYDAPSGYDGIATCCVLSHGQAGPNSLTIVKA